MSEYKFLGTQGPWRYQVNSDAYTHIVRTNPNRFLCQLSQDSSGLSEANARLIAAAPELLEACKIAYEILRTIPLIEDYGPKDEHPVYILKAAIHKALNKQ